jgi:hypothetical protein
MLPPDTRIYVGAPFMDGQLVLEEVVRYGAVVQRNAWPIRARSPIMNRLGEDPTKEFS